MAIADVELFGIGVVIERIHQPADFVPLKLRDGWKRIWQRIYAITKTAEALASVRHSVRLSWVARCPRTAGANCENRCKQRGIELLQHEQRDVQKRLAVVDASATADQVLTFASNVESEANARAEVLVVVLR